LSGCAGYLRQERVESFSDSMKFFEDDTLFMVVRREVLYRTIVLGSGDNIHSSTLYYYRLGFHRPKGGGPAELTSVREVSRRHESDGSAALLADDELAPLVSQHRENLFLPGNHTVVTDKPAGANGFRARRWNGSLWFLVWRVGQADVVTDADQSVTYTCPPTGVINTVWNCWDTGLGLVLFTESLGERPPPPGLDYLPPKAYLWYYRENRVETYTIDRVAVDKALRRFIRKQK
jgi:hypothetical protein